MVPELIVKVYKIGLADRRLTYDEILEGEGHSYGMIEIITSEPSI